MFRLVDRPDILTMSYDGSNCCVPFRRKRISHGNTAAADLVPLSPEFFWHGPIAILVTPYWKVFGPLGLVDQRMVLILATCLRSEEVLHGWKEKRHHRERSLHIRNDFSISMRIDIQECDRAELRKRPLGSVEICHVFDHLLCCGIFRL